MDDQFTIKPGGVSKLDGRSLDITRKVKDFPLLFEMLRSFTTLARTLNLSHAVKELGSTRQTLRRHISQIEEMKGVALFEISERQYKLTEAGQKILPEALDLLAQAEAWAYGNTRQVDGLQYISSVHPDGWFFYQQQHRISRVFSASSPLLRDSVLAWTESGGQLEHSAMSGVRPMFNVFRKVDHNWLFTEVGDDSSFVSWVGWKNARSSIGRVMGQLPYGTSIERLMSLAYQEVEKTDSIRLDHIFTVLPLGDDAVPTPVVYERLLLGARFPDDSFAMISVARRTYDVEIEGVTPEMLKNMPEEYLM